MSVLLRDSQTNANHGIQSRKLYLLGVPGNPPNRSKFMSIIKFNFMCNCGASRLGPK